jgi:transposase
VKALTVLPGVGPLTAMIIVAEVGDVSRFSSTRKLAPWAGLTPTVRGSETAPCTTGTSPSRVTHGCAGS